jgi:hypothetical protein
MGGHRERLGSGETTSPLAVPAHASRDEQIVLHLDNALLLARLHALLRGSVVEYRVEAEHYVDLIGFRGKPFRSVASGSLDLGAHLEQTH